MRLSPATQPAEERYNKSSMGSGDGSCCVADAALSLRVAAKLDMIMVERVL